MQTVLYIGTRYGSAAQTVGRVRYVFGGNKTHRLNTMLDEHAEELCTRAPMEFMTIATDQGHDKRIIDNLLESVMVTPIKMTKAQRDSLYAAGIMNLAQMCACSPDEVAGACGIAKDGAKRLIARAMKHVEMEADGEDEEVVEEVMREVPAEAGEEAEEEVIEE